MFWTCSNTGNVPLTYDDQVDAFGVYCPELDCVYLVPKEGTGTRTCSLRLQPAGNNQIAGIRLAADYEVGVTGP